MYRWGGEFFYNYACECTDSQEQCGTLVIIPKIPVYTISIDYWYDERIDYSYKSEIYWERVGMKRWRNCTYLINRDIFIMGNADKLELHFFSPKPEAFSTLEDPESPDDGLGEIEHHLHSVNFLLTKISVEPLEKSAVTYTDLNGRAHYLADCKGFQSPIYYTALNGQIKSIAVIPQAHPMASPVRIAQCQNGGSIANLGWKILERFPYLFQNDILTLLRYD